MVGCAPVRIVSGVLWLAAAGWLAGRVEAQTDPSAGWRTLHTPHFRIHFRPEARAAALEEAREAERAYALLARELHPPRGIVDITLSDDTDVANGAATPIPSNRIEIFPAPPATDPELQHYDHWLRVATTHELTHIFHLDRTRGFWRVGQRLFGRVPGLFPNQYQPTWVAEGLATYYESKLTNGGRVTGSFHTQVLASESAAGAARSPWNALFFSRWPSGVAPYAYGSRFFRYLADTIGDSVIPQFAEATSGQLIPFRVGRPLARATRGTSLEDAWRRGTSAPAPATPLASSTVLDRGLWAEPVASVSPGGRLVAYVWDDGKGAQRIRVVTAADWRPLRTRRVTGEVSCDWLGDTLIVSQLDFTSRWRRRSDLYRWLPDGRWERTTRGARLQQPRAGGGLLSTIAVVPGGNRATLFGAEAGDNGVTWGDVVPSPDGRWIAATRSVAGHWTLVRWPGGAPGKLETLVASRGVVTDPRWTPAGELLFVSDGTGYPQVYRWRDSAGAIALTAEPAGARAPAALGDGTLLYATFAASGWELRRARPDSSARSSGAPPPAPAPLAFDPAPAVEARETGYSGVPSLRPHFWIPAWLDRGSTGRFAGATTAGADAVGRYSYAGTAYVSGSPLRASGSFDGVSHLFGNPSLDLSLSSDWWFAAQSAGAVVSERDQDAALGATFVRERWRTVASVRVAAEYEGTHYRAIPDAAPTAICSGCVDQDLTGGSVTLRLRSFDRGALAISPEDGFRWSATYRRRDEQGTARWSNELRSQLALFVRVPGAGGFAHHVLAARFAAGWFTGPLPTQFAVGGVRSGALAVGLGQPGGATRDFPVRGYAARELRGRRAAAASIEYRMPLALVGRLLGHLPLGADKLSLSLFADAGDAWNAGGSPRPARLRSIGAELVGDMTVSYDAPLRLRLGVADPLAAPPSGAARRPQVYVAVSSAF